MNAPANRHRTDLGRRVAARRGELGLSREDVARRTGVAPDFVEGVEERGDSPGTRFLRRLADVLETGVDELTGRTADVPPGQGAAPAGAALRVIGEDECRALLSGGGVGRVAVTTPDGPVITPVNYLVSEGEIYYRTALGAAPSTAAGQVAAFEVDRIDDTFRQGWSVLVTGTGRFVTDEAAVRELEATAPGLAWAGENRSTWLAITPHRITGRRIVNRLHLS
jgi:nitroimidazol reductase NimA-like FMN-containing flavoprotein (pyridoxamine 5'-phosphate oxidase superfamily)